MKLSKNFEDKEFYCPCKNCKKDKLPDDKLVTLLQNLRDKLNQPIYITKGGGIRCRNYNKIIGGYVDSPHLYGKAIDIHVKDMDIVSLAKQARDIGFSRIGLYRTFIHLDIIEPYPSASWIRDVQGKYFYFKTLENAIIFSKEK